MTCRPILLLFEIIRLIDMKFYLMEDICSVDIVATY